MELELRPIQECKNRSPVGFSKDESKKVKKGIEDEIKRLLYNKRDVPIKNRKMVDNKNNYKNRIKQ